MEHASNLFLAAASANQDAMRDVARARTIVLTYGWNATAYQILNPGILHWFAAGGDAVVGFVDRAGTLVVAGAPVCTPDRLLDVVAEFVVAAHGAGRRVCFFGAGQRLEEALAPSGQWSAASLGAQPSWDPAEWPALLRRRKSLRAQLNRARNKSVAVTQWRELDGAGRAAVEHCLAEWLARRGLPPLHFLVEPDTLGQLADRWLFVATRDEKVAGFLVASPVPARQGWLIEQIIRADAAPNGTAELLVDAAMRAAAARGARYVTLGLSPLSRHSSFDDRRTPAWLRFALRWVRAHTRRFYDFEGLDRFKSKFAPGEWENIVALADAPRFPPRALWAIASAFSRGSPLTLIARALLRAARQEIRWLLSGARRALQSRGGGP